jgi:hypothetical protein
MKINNKIGWQKYEDVLENQLSSPLFQDLMSNIIDGYRDSDPQDSEHTEEDVVRYSPDEDFNPEPVNVILPVPVSNDMANEISLVTTFDCWVGHTNFDITPSVKRILDEINGVEVLKICSRYRFFIGVGKMFEFKTVRENIEKIIKDKDYDGN